MKKLIGITLFALLLLGCNPKTPPTEGNVVKGISFVKSTDYLEVLAKAKAEKKPIFIDFYTTWCAPCKWLEKDVFELKDVSVYYNKNFINFKVNAEDFDGVPLAQQFSVKAYPTLIFLTQDGEVVHRHEGTTTASKFLEYGRQTEAKNKDKAEPMN